MSAPRVLSSPSALARVRRSGVVRPLIATVFVATSGVLPIFLVGAIGVQLRRDLRFGEAGLGQAIAWSQLLAAACSGVFGKAAERLGPARSMRWSSAVSCVSMLAVAGGARSLTSLSLLLVGSGVANSLSQPATNLYISRVVPQRRQGIAFAVKQSSMPAAALLGSLAVPGFALTVGWRWAFVAGAVIAACGAFATTDVTSAAAAKRDGRRDQPIAVLALVGVGIGLGAFAASALSSFTTSSLTRSGFSEAGAGWLAAAGSALVICTRLFAGARSDRTPAVRFGLVALMLTVGSVGFAVMGLMSAPALIIGMSITYTFGWGWPGLSNLSIARANPSGPAAASGVTQTGTYAGVAAGPLAFGWLAEHVSYGAAYVCAAAASLCGAACVVAATRRLVPWPGRGLQTNGADPPR